MRVFPSICLGFFLFALQLNSARALNIWIDTDAAIASPFRDPDDAFALLLALHSRELRLIGISATYGNGPLSLSERSAREVIDRFGTPRSLSATILHAGANSPRDLGSTSPATAALARTLSKRKLTFLALGPLTNLASLIMLHPELAARIDRVVFIGGRTEPGALKLNFIRVHDANVLKDPAAVEVVLRSKIPMLVVPIDVAARLGLNRDDIERLRASGAADRFLIEKSELWSWWFTRVIKYDAPLFDALGVLALTRPDLISTRPAHASLSCDRGSLVFDRASQARSITLCTAFRPEGKAVMLERWYYTAVP